MVKILLLDDEVDLRVEVADFLRGIGYLVTEVGSIRQFYQFFQADKFDVLLLDRLLPDGDALDLVKEIREKGSRIGIVMFTAMDSTKDRIDGFQFGADHYVSKPVRMEELSGLIRVLSWRVSGPNSWLLSTSNWALSTPDNAVISLTTQEFSFLRILIESGSRIPISRDQIVEKMGKDVEKYDSRNLDTLVLRLRKKVEDACGHPLPLKTVHGTGYLLSNVIAAN